MRLRGQLLVLLLATTLLPWAGCQYVRELEDALREGQAQTLRSAAMAMARAVEPAAAAFTAPDTTAGVRGDEFYVHRLTRAPEVDGFDADWPLEDSARQRLADAISWVRVGRTDRHLYLFVSVIDDVVLTAEPRATAPGGLRVHDRIVVKSSFDNGEGTQRFIFAAEAPGSFTPRLADARWRVTAERAETVLAHWQPRRDGYQVEIRMPLGLVGPRLGIGFVDVDVPSEPGREILSWSRGHLPGRLVETRPALAAVLERNLPAGMRAEVIDAAGWRLASGGMLAPVPRLEQEASVWIALRNRVFEWWLQGDELPRPSDAINPQARTAGTEIDLAAQGDTAMARYRIADGTVLAVAVPLAGGGTLLLEQGSAEIITLTNRALTGVLTMALGIMGLFAVLLLGYASWLSWRIARLSRAARGALGPRGELTASLPGTGQGDELGDLARSFETLLQRLDGYTGYLRSLGGKLSHELKTPLAVVNSSLENLPADAPPAEQAPYLARARAGTARLGNILASLSEATKAEDMVRHSARERYRPAPVVESCARAYQALHTGRQWRWQLADAPGGLDGSPELLAQALDKLIDNAVEFSAADGLIELKLSQRRGQWILSVTNEGASLPADAGDSLFDSLVSHRAGPSAQPHLGLGLYIVRLVAEFHGGYAQAENVERGVCISLHLPVVPLAD